MCLKGEGVYSDFNPRIYEPANVSKVKKKLRTLQPVKLFPYAVLIIPCLHYLYTLQCK